MKKIILILNLFMNAFAGNIAAQSLDFDGTNDFVSTTLDADRDAMPVTTWEAWIYPTAADSKWRMVMGMDDGKWGRFIALQGGKFFVGVTTGSWSPANYTLNEWQHIAVVFETGSVKFYRNGTEYIYGSGEGAHLSAGTFTIGANQFRNLNYKGKIDELLIFNF
jgi:hypothetical protein